MQRHQDILVPLRPSSSHPVHGRDQLPSEADTAVLRAVKVDSFAQRFLKEKKKSGSKTTSVLHAILEMDKVQK